MCGIVGVFDTIGKRPIASELLGRMNESQHHRGPDGGGLHLEQGLGLGHRRLAIIDVASGKQPLYNEDGSVVVVYNGEIYNFQELVVELEELGHRFCTRSDTEVIVHAWESWGAACVTRFRGMFAFALWDRSAETLFLARDRLGVKPLHYAWLADGTFIFGSELKALLAHGGLDRRVDPEAVEDYFAFGYVPEPRTIFAQALKLPPGHALTQRRNAPRAEPVEYWDLRFTSGKVISDGDACAELVQRLRDSVRLRLISEVPLGAFLSGGLDSSAVVAMMAGLNAEPINTCSIAFGDPVFDESAYARAVSQRYRTRHHVDVVDNDEFGLLDRIAAIYDEPYSDSSALPTYRVCQLARTHVTVALSGDGGDEAFVGYRRYRLHAAEERMRSSIPLAIRRPLFGALGRLYPKADWAPRVLRAKTTLEALARDSVAAYFDTVSVVRGDLRRRLFSPVFRQQLAGYSALDVFRRHAARYQGDDALALVQYLDFKTYLVGDINTKVDRASMAHGLEVREPLMDHLLVEWLATLPSSMKLRGGRGKWLLKRAMEPWLPRELLHRRKMGFAVPLASWLRGPLRSRVHRLVRSERLLDTGYFAPEFLRSLADAHLAGARDHGAPLWSLLMFDAFLARQAGAAPTAGRAAAGGETALSR